VENRRSAKRGIAAAWVIVCLPVFLWLLILVVEVGWVSICRGHLQSAADLGALAGAQELDYTLLADGICRLDVASASQIAAQYTQENLSRSLHHDHLVACTIAVRVQNPGDGYGAGEYPKIRVEVTLPVKLPLSRTGRTMSAYGEASILPRH